MHFFTNYSKTTRISFIRGSQASMLPVASTVVIVTVAGSRRSRRDRPSTLPTSSKLPVVIAILATTTPVTEIHNRCRRQKSPVGIHTGWTLPPQPLAPSWGGGREFSCGLPLRPDPVTDSLRHGPILGVLYWPLELRGEREPLPQHAQ